MNISSLSYFHGETIKQSEETYLQVKVNRLLACPYLSVVLYR